MERNINNKDQGTLHMFIMEFIHLGLHLQVHFKMRDHFIDAKKFFSYNGIRFCYLNTSVNVKIDTSSEKQNL